MGGFDVCVAKIAKTFGIAVVLFVVSAMSSPVSAGDFTWVGTDGTNPSYVNLPSNWSPGEPSGSAANSDNWIFPMRPRLRRVHFRLFRLRRRIYGWRHQRRRDYVPGRRSNLHVYAG